MSNLLQTLEAICVSNGSASPSQWQNLSTGINSNQDLIEGFLNYLKGKLQEPNLDRQLLLLDIVDYLVDQCTISFWTQISSKAFLSLLLSLLKSRNIPELQVKILYLIQKWAQKFEQYKDILPNFKEIYTGMINSGVVFPTNVDSTYQKYLGFAKSQPVPKQQSMQNDYSEDFNQYQTKESDDNYDGSYAENLSSSLNTDLYEKKYAKLINYLASIVDFISLGNEIIDNSKVGGQVEESLKDIAEPLRNGNNRLIETISSDKLKDEKLMEMSLGIIEDINRTLNRYEMLKLAKKPEPFLSTFTEKNIQKGISPKRKANPQQKNPKPSTNNNNNNTNNTNVIKPQEIDPNIKNVDDLFDIFSKPGPVQVNNPFNNQLPQPNPQYPNFKQGNNINFQSQSHPMDLFDINPPQIQMPQKPKEKSQIDILSEQLSQSYIIKDQQMGGNMGYGMQNQGMGIGQGIIMPNQGIGMGMNIPNQDMRIPNDGMIMPNQEINVSKQQIGMGMPNQGIRIQNQGINVPNQGMPNQMNLGIGMNIPNQVMPNQMNDSNMPMGNTTQSMNLPPLKMNNNQYNQNNSLNQQPKLYTNSVESPHPSNQLYPANNSIPNSNPNYNNINNPNYSNINPNGQDNMSESERNKLNAIDSLF